MPSRPGVGNELGELRCLLLGRLCGEEDQVGRPWGLLYGVVARHGEGTAPLPGFRLHGFHEGFDVVEVADAGGVERGEFLAEADEGDCHAVRPAAGGELRGDRREDGTLVRVRAGE